MKLHFETAGDPSAPALLLVHGFMSCRLQWQPNVEALEKRFHLVMVDLWGHGRSPAPREDTAYLPEGFAEAFDDVRQSLGIERWSVCGQSFGAGLVVQYAHAAPQIVDTIITTNSRSAFAPTLSDRAPQMSREDWETADLRRLPYHPRHALRFPPDLREQLATAADGIDRHGLWACMTITGPRLTCLPIFDGIAQPFLLVNGLMERGFQAERQRFEDAMPAAEIVDIDGGHSVNIENPGGFNAAVIDFLARHNPANQGDPA